MLNRLIDFCIDNRWLVLVFLLAFVAGSIYVALQIPIDAFPDLTNNQVVVITECPGMPPTEVEQLVTYPLESVLMGVPRTQGIRSVSKLGLSMVTLVFDDAVNPYFARQIVNERLQDAQSRLPETVKPSLGPIATAFGEVYQYTLEGSNLSLMERKTLHEWSLKNQLRSLRGINEVNTWGGLSKQYTVEVDPDSLQRYGLTLRDIYDRVRENNLNFGGGFIEHAGEQYTVLGIGRTRGVEDLGAVVLLERGGTPVLIRDVARVMEDASPRQGAVLRDGKGETVSGMVIMLRGENGRRAIDRVKQRISELRLPSGVQMIPFYDQSEVINGSIATVTRNLLEAGALVAAVLLAFLGNFRAALLVVAVIPLSMLFGFTGMAIFGVTANLMSLGALDFGMIVDGAIVMVENSVRRLGLEAKHSDSANDTVREVVRKSAHEVARPIVFAVAIIIAVYLPVLLLEGLEGRMFRPMAITVCSALLGSLLLALFVVPVLATFALRKAGGQHKEGWFGGFRAAYRRSLEHAMKHRHATVVLGLIPVVIALASLAYIGTEFMPRLDEGSLLIQTRKLPGISLTESIALSNAMEKAVLEFPEVRSVVTKLGRPDLATEAMGIYEADVYVLLKPGHVDKEQLIEKLSARLEKIPGAVFNFTQPMAMRLDETISGIKADVAVKIFGENTDVLTQLADRALRIVRTIPGAADVQAEVVSGVAELRVEVDRVALSRYGLNVSQVREILDSSTGGLPVSQMIEGQRRFPIAIRLPEKYRTDLQALGNLVLRASDGGQVRLNQVAHIGSFRGPEVVTREDGQRRIVVQANVRGRDLGGFVAEAQKRMAALTLPPGYRITWGGQFENQERSLKRLAIVLPASILIIVGLLYATFHSWSQALLILLNVPFAFVGGIAMLWLRGINLNLSASIGFIALFGVAVLNGIVMVSYINQLRAADHSVRDAVLDGASMRLRPVLMTALVASLGFIPMAFSRAMGSEVQRPLATVVIGGLISATVLTLYILPVLYPWFSGEKVVECSVSPDDILRCGSK